MSTKEQWTYDENCIIINANFEITDDVISLLPGRCKNDIIKHAKKLEKRVKNYTENIYREIFYDNPNIDIPDDADKRITEVLNNIRERNADAIIKHFMYGMTYKELSVYFGVGTERARDITLKGIRRLRHPKMLKILTNDPNIDCKATSAENARSIEELNFSVRTRNCLKRGGINTIEDLINKTEGDIICIRNMGVKSFNEIKSKLSDMGLKLRRTEDSDVFDN